MKYSWIRMRTRHSMRMAIVLAFALVAVLLTAQPRAAHADASTGTGGLFVAKTARIWDTTTGRDGAPTAGMTANQWYTVGVAGSEGLPATGISAVQLDFYVSGAAGSGVLNADTSSSAAASTHGISYVNFTTAAVSGSGTIAVGADGKIRVKVTQDADLRIDVQGYYTAGATSAGGYVPVTPTAIKSYSDVASNTYLSFNVGGVSPIPSTASGVILSIQESGASGTGYLIAYPAGAARPSTALYWPSTRNFDFSTAVALGTSGQVSLYVGTGGPVDLSISVQGYYQATAGTSVAGSFTPGAARVFDSRTASTPIASGDTSTVQVTGVAGVPDTGTGIDSVAVNIGIIAGSGASGHLQVYADDSDPGTSAQQFYASTTTSIFAVVPLGADGGITVQNSSGGTINVVVDVEGWFQGIDPATISCPSPYDDGVWTDVPTSSVSCVVRAPASPTTTGVLHLSLDDDVLPDVPLSRSSVTTATVTVPAGPGQHSILATTNESPTGAGNDATYSFGSGDWASAGLIGDVNPDGSGYLTPELSVASDGDALPSDATMRYTVYDDAAATNPIAVSDWTTDSYTVPDQVLAAGDTYFWKVEVVGTSGGASTPSDVTSDLWSYSPPFTSEPSNGGVGSGSCKITTTFSNVKSGGPVVKSPSNQNWKTSATGPGKLSLTKARSLARTYSASVTIKGSLPKPVASEISATVGYSVTATDTSTVGYTINVPAGKTLTLQADAISNKKTFSWKKVRRCIGFGYAIPDVVTTGTGYSLKLDHIHFRSYASKN